MANDTTILIADDEPNIRRVLEAMFTKQGFQVITAENGRRAISLANDTKVDVLISDLIMPDMSGVEVLKAVKQIRPECSAIMVTAYGTIKTAVEAMRLGAYDYITKPFDLDQVLKLVKRSLDDREAAPAFPGIPAAASHGKPQKGGKGTTLGQFVGASPAMQELYSTLERAADSRATVLIRGESGTGKELVARALHMHSSRAGKPFVAISCAALPETLLESELFGHEKNAFTGAAALKPGRFEMANQGTLFLDEVGEIPATLQIKLLRVLQEREFERLGGTKSIKVDVRVVAATNKDLEKAVQNGEFREDLYYRLQVIQVFLPPLRERREDIPALAEHFVTRYSKENGRCITSISPKTLELLTAYNYPGNVRELENAIERAVVMSDRDAQVLEPDWLPNAIRLPKTAQPPQKHT
jgi:DNA-binding NtrC family response regulator